MDTITWIDVETTGLVAHKEELLEVACFVTDYDGKLLDETGFHAVIHHSAEDTERLRAGAVPFVQDMHDRTGLWARLPAGTPREIVDAGLLEYIQQFSGHRESRLGGNSIRLDLNFLEEHLPAAYGHLHYRFIDVTTLMELAFQWAGVPRPTAVPAHTATDDILGSIEQFKQLRKDLNLFPPTADDQP